MDAYFSSFSQLLAEIGNDPIFPKAAKEIEWRNIFVTEKAASNILSTPAKVIAADDRLEPISLAKYILQRLIRKAVVIIWYRMKSPTENSGTKEQAAGNDKFNHIFSGYKRILKMLQCII